MTTRRAAPMSFVSLAAFVLVALAPPALAGSKRPAAGDLLGIHVGMDETAARARLKRIGEPLTKLESPKQTWNLRDKRYSSLTIRYDSQWRVQWMTVVAREGGTRVRYRDIGDLARAHRSGSYVYTWTASLAGGGVPRAITARGPDPVYLASVSIHPPGPASRPDSSAAGEHDASGD